MSFDDYDGVSWSKADSGRRVALAGPPYQVSVPDGPVRSDEVERLPGAGPSDGTVWAPGQIVSIAGVGSASLDEDGNVRVSPQRRQYTVTTVEPVGDLNRLASAGPAPTWPTSGGGPCPSACPHRITELAKQLTAGATNRYDKAALIAAYLRENLTYTLDSPVPLPGQDAVDRFLFVDRTGFCEQFASAQVVMLRTLGIPSRLVTGLAYGVPDGGQRLFRMRDLHAWVELWVPGVGWVSSDPTAGVPLASSGRRDAAAAGLRGDAAHAAPPHRAAGRQAGPGSGAGGPGAAQQRRDHPKGASDPGSATRPSGGSCAAGVPAAG